jgi:hypothetical protein
MSGGAAVWELEPDCVLIFIAGVNLLFTFDP